MARIRTIKPDFFIDDKVGELTVIARLLFVGLWCLADREGRLEDNPKKIKVQILPYDKTDCDAVLDEIAGKEMIVRYEVEGKNFIQINNFLKHQRPHHTEKDSDLPDFNGEITVKQPSMDGEKKVGREGKGKERNGMEKRVGRREKTHGSPPALTDDQFLDSLKTNPAYEHICFEREFGKMDAWLAVNKSRKKTRRFVVNWLNRIEKPMSEGGGNGKPKSVVAEYFEELRAKENALDVGLGAGLEGDRGTFPEPAFDATEGGDLVRNVG